MYHIVYDEKGQIFEVPLKVLEKLVVQHGWTIVYPFNVDDVFKNTEEK